MEMREAEEAFEAWCVNGEIKGLISKSCWLAGVRWERQRMGELGSKVINRMVEAGSNLIKSEAKLDQQLKEAIDVIKFYESFDTCDETILGKKARDYLEKWSTR